MKRYAPKFQRSILTAALAAGLLCAAAASTRAALLSQYTFEDGTGADSVGTYDLAAAGAGATFTDGTAVIDTSSADYLATSAYGGLGFGSFTVSLWVNASDVTQGNYKGLFSNNSGSTTAYSWQMDNSGGAYRLISYYASNAVGPTSGLAAPVANTWQNVVVEKIDATTAKLYVDGHLAATASGNIGNLNSFRLGINRTGDNSYGAAYDGVQVFNDVQNALSLAQAGRFTPTHSWIAGVGGDTSGDNQWTATRGGVNLGFGSAKSYSPTGLDYAPQYYSAPGATGGAAASDGVFGGSGDASFEIFTRPANLTGTHILFEVGGNASGTSLALVDNELRLTTQTDTSHVMTVSTLLDNSLIGQWLDITAVLHQPGDGTGAAELFLNGVSVGSDTIASGYTSWAGANGFGVGALSSTAAGTFTNSFTNYTGDIALFNHYNYALSSTSVADLAASQFVPTPAALPAGLALMGVLGIKRRRHLAPGR